VEGWRESSRLAEFVCRDAVAGGSDEARGKDDSGCAVCEDERGQGVVVFVGDGGRIGVEEGRW
jgi:hypothetical protein